MMSRNQEIAVWNRKRAGMYF